MPTPLPQEFPRDLALLRLEDVLPELNPAVRPAFRIQFEARRADPLAPGGLVIAGTGGLRPLMAVMRLMVLRLRDLNLERFETQGSEGRYLSSYVRGENLRLPLPERAAALFVERADLAPPESAPALKAAAMPLFATWEGARSGPVWSALAARCDLIRLEDNP